jgi:hypothetical protein
MRDAGQNDATQRVRMLREVVPEVVMGAKLPGVMFEDVDGDINERRRAEADWTLDAIVGAIAAGKLPPDDAAAWAKIAAYEIEMLGLAPAA